MSSTAEVPQYQEKCFDYQDGTDTAGNPIMRRKCYCGTTACQQNQTIILGQLVCSYSGKPVEKHLGHWHCKDQFCFKEHCEPIMKGDN